MTKHTNNIQIYTIWHPYINLQNTSISQIRLVQGIEINNSIKKDIACNWRIGGVCIIFHATVVDAPVGIANAGFTIVFSLATGIIKKLLSTTRNKNKKYYKILKILKAKSNSVALKL